MLTTLTVAGLAAAQITYLVTTSTIFDLPRERIGRIHDKIAYWVSCPWCFSAWVAFAICVYLRPDHPVLAWAAIWWIACTGFWATQVLARYANL